MLPCLRCLGAGINRARNAVEIGFGQNRACVSKLAGKVSLDDLVNRRLWSNRRIEADGNRAAKDFGCKHEFSLEERGGLVRQALLSMDHAPGPFAARVRKAKQNSSAVSPPFAIGQKPWTACAMK